MDALDDAELLRAYAAGDLWAFEALYARHKGPLFRYLLRQVRQPALAEDLFQEVWSRVIGARDRYQARAKFQTYLFTIAHHCCVDHWRRSSARGGDAFDSGPIHDDLLPAPAQDGPERRHGNDELRSKLRNALDLLPREQRDVFLLYEESGLSLEQIAAVTGVGMETAKSRLRYAVGKLRATLESTHAEHAT